MSTKQIFGGIIAVILLGLYIYLTGSAIRGVFLCTGDKSSCGSILNDQMESAMSLIGGLVSALVIAVLAINKPGEPPNKTLGLTSAAHPKANLLIDVITVIYVSIWILIGLIALVLTWIYPKAYPPLTNLGQAWLGLAIAAGYAFFGLNQT